MPKAGHLGSFKRRKLYRKRKAPHAYDAAFVNETLEQFELGRIEGLSNSAIFSKLKASPATVYRWIQASGNVRPRLRSAKDKRLAAAISTLCGARAADDWDYLEALLTFAVWLHWPARSDYGPIGTASFLALYASKKANIKLVSDLPADAIRVLAKNLRLRDIASLCSSVDFDLPTFMWDVDDDDESDNRIMLAEGCAILLALADLKVRRMAPSINKVIYLWRSGATEHKVVASRDTLLRRWAADAHAAPFFYVERYHAKLDWGLNPESHLFTPKIDRLLQNRSEVVRFFQMAKDVTLVLQKSLHRNALQRLDFPRFPASLEPLAVTPPSLNEMIKNALKSYKSSLSY